MRRFHFWVSALSVLLVTTVTLAQGQGQGGRRQGGFGGGFGGGGFGGPSGGNAALMLINAEPVQKDLELKEDQVAKVKTLGEEVRKEMEANRGNFNFGEFQNLSEEERNKRIEEMRVKGVENARKLNEKFRPKLAEILDAKQQERLRQIGWQVVGSQALLDAELAKSLDLSDDQKKKLTDVSKEFEDKQRELFRGGPGGGDFQERFAKMRELNESRDKALTAVLSKEQTTKYTALLGPEFDVAELRRGFGGPGGRGPGGDRPNAPGRPRRPQSDDKKSEDSK